MKYLFILHQFMNMKRRTPKYIQRYIYPAVFLSFMANFENEFNIRTADYFV